MKAESNKPRKVLIVDDEESICRVCKLALEVEGFETACATTCTEALATMERFQADLLLLDIKFPDGSGLDFLPTFKKLYPAVPVIILTGLGYEEPLLQSALKNGAQGFVTKGVLVENMVSAVHNILH